MVQLGGAHSGVLSAEAESPASRISAPTLEELHHEAREALIALVGPVPVTCQMRIRSRRLESRSAIRPSTHRPGACLDPPLSLV